MKKKYFFEKNGYNHKNVTITLCSKDKKKKKRFCKKSGIKSPLFQLPSLIHFIIIVVQTPERSLLAFPTKSKMCFKVLLGFLRALQLCCKLLIQP